MSATRQARLPLALLVLGLATAALGAVLHVEGTAAVTRAEEQSRALAEAARVRGQAFTRTLDTAQASEQLKVLGARRDLLRAATAAQRRRALGLLLLIGGALLCFAAYALARIRRDLDDLRG